MRPRKVSITGCGWMTHATNCWRCLLTPRSHCGDMTTMTDFSGEVHGRSLILCGMCVTCRGKVAGVLEGASEHVTLKPGDRVIGWKRIPGGYYVYPVQATTLFCAFAPIAHNGQLSRLSFKMRQSPQCSPQAARKRRRPQQPEGCHSGDYFVVVVTFVQVVLLPTETQVIFSPTLIPSPCTTTIFSSGALASTQFPLISTFVQTIGMLGAGVWAIASVETRHSIAIALPNIFPI
jgi:hypothetical protein